MEKKKFIIKELLYLGDKFLLVIGEIKIEKGTALVGYSFTHSWNKSTVDSTLVLVFISEEECERNV